MHGGMKVYGERRRPRGTTSSPTDPVPTTTTSPRAAVSPCGSWPPPDAVEHRAGMDGETYEQWVAGFDVETGTAKGRLRTDDQAVRFVEVTVNGPKTWSLAAALHAEIAEAYDAAQMAAAEEIIGWL